MFDNQFYPTPLALTLKAWSLFQTPIVKVLEPSAGDGHLLSGLHMTEADFRARLERLGKTDQHDIETLVFHWKTNRQKEMMSDNAKVDVIEIDIEKHPLLRSKGYKVVGHDFMQFQGVSMYSHIIMNPPFAYGVEHVLKAWNILFDGELVAIINAETIKNPYSKERQLLCSLIERHGSVEFVQNAFNSDDSERSTDVEIALIYLRKTGDFLGSDLLGDLKQDSASADTLSMGFEAIQALAIPENEVENAVRVFNAAVLSMREAVFAKHKAARYAQMLGSTLAAFDNRNDAPKTNDIRKDVIAEYEELKDRAWTRILRSSNVTKRLSEKGQKSLEAQFEDVKKMDFTISNIYSFLMGLINSQASLNMEMALDVFDKVTYYHTENAVWYKGWKSNDKHLSNARRMKTTRFILPNHHRGWGKAAAWETVRLLGDFDKVFAILDGRDIMRKDESNPFIGLADLFESPDSYARLCSGERLSSDYFDVRYYPGAGTIHFFPRSKTLVDRLNRLVGRHRQWLPDESEAGVPEAFWIQYENAEKYAKDIEAKIKNERAAYIVNASYHGESSERLAMIEKVGQAIDSVLEANGINPTLAITKLSNIASFPAICKQSQKAA